MIDKNLAGMIQRSAVQALHRVAEQAGMTVTAAGGTMDGTSVTLKFKFSDATPEAKVTDEARINGELELLGLDAKYGDIFRAHNGISYRIVDTALSRPKFPIIGERVQDGKRFKFTASTIRATTGTVRAPVTPMERTEQ